MKTNNCLAFLIVSLSVLITISNQAKLHPAVTLCKRNNATINDCYCQNLRKMIPLLKGGAPEMRIPSLDPINVVNIVMDLTKLHSVHLVASLFNIIGNGSSLGKVSYCDAKFTDTGMAHQLTLEFPLLTIDATCKMMGSFANFTLNSTGDVHAEFRGIFVNTTWTGTKYTKKNNQEYLDFNCKFDDLELESVKFRFDKIFRDNPQMDDVFNDVVADNIHLISSEMLPIAEDVIKSISVRMVDSVYDAFSYDELFPL